MVEGWRDIEGFEGLYQISNLGRVKSLERHICYYDTRWGRYVDKVNKERILKSVGDTYQIIQLRKDNKYFPKYIHRLVASAFIPNPENKPEVNHKDRNPRNNRLDNLEWVTSKENTLHLISSGYDMGANTRGKQLTDEHKRKISKSLKGHSSYVRTQETKDRYRRSYKYACPVKCLEDGMVFSCKAEAAEYYNIDDTSITNSINEKRAIKKKWTFVPMSKEEYNALGV